MDILSELCAERSESEQWWVHQRHQDARQQCVAGLRNLYMKEWCTLEEVYEAYLDCRKRKRSSKSCSVFETNEMANIHRLWQEILHHTYEIGYSDAFCVTRPKLREVFAAEFRDRIVHHLLVKRTIALFEAHFVQDTYNCRKGKGTDYGVRRMVHFAEKYKDGWVLVLDLRGFFMSIDKRILAEMLERFLRENYHREDIEDVIWLSRLIVMHRPQDRCIRKGDLTKWNDLPREKSLFTTMYWLGLAIGNLTSQIDANFYLSPFDYFMAFVLRLEMGRYVDDFATFSMEKDKLLLAIPKIREFLWEQLRLTLHPMKVYLQPVRHGFKFCGSVIKPGRVYAGNRTVGNAMNMILHYNKLKNKETVAEEFVQRYNSYMGYLVHRNAYAIRWNLWNLVSEEWKEFVYIENMCVMRVRVKYKTKTKLLEQYGKKRNAEKRLRGISNRVCEERCAILPPANQPC